MAYYPFSPEIGARYVLTNSTNGAVAVFNDPTDALYAGMLTEVTGLDSPDVRESAEELAQADGGTHGYFYFGRRPITLSGRLFGHATKLERNTRLDYINRASMALRGDSILSWKPSSREENLLKNPGFETNTTDWVAYQNGGATATLTRTTSQSRSGSASAQLAVTATGSDVGISSNSTSAPISAGQSISTAGYVRSSTSRNAYSILAWYNSSGSFLSSSTGSTVASSTSGWTRTPTLTVVAPVGAAYVSAYVVFSTVTSGQTHFVDDVMLNVGTSVNNYFDGSTTGYYWQGDANASASGNFIEMFTPVRRQGPLRISGAWNKDFQVPLVSEFAPMYSVGLRTLSATAGTGVVVENRGSWPAYPILRITGPTSVTNPTITQSAGGSGVINTTGSLLVASGETLEIDTLNHTAAFTAGARNGQSGNSFINFSTTVWPTMPTGNSTFTLNGTTGTLAVVWRDTWV